MAAMSVHTEVTRPEAGLLAELREQVLERGVPLEESQILTVLRSSDGCCRSCSSSPTPYG